MTVRAVAAPSRADLDAAAAVVAAHLAPTPLIPAPALGDGVHLKLETLQPTGSFKVRGGRVQVRARRRGDRADGHASASRSAPPTSATAARERRDFAIQRKKPWITPS